MAEQLTVGKTRTLDDAHGNTIIMRNGLRDSSVLACADGALHRMAEVIRKPEAQEAMAAVRQAVSQGASLWNMLTGKNTLREVNAAEPPIAALCAAAKKSQGR